MYADIEKLKSALGLNARRREPVYTVIAGPDLETAIEYARTDAVKVIRCKNGFWCVDSRRLREPLCTVPGRPACSTSPEGFCDRGKDRSGGNG